MIKRLIALLQSKARSIVITVWIAIGLLQTLVGTIGDVLAYCMALAVLWIAGKLGALK